MLKSTEISAGAFKSKCLQLMDDVNESNCEFIITKFKHPVAKLVPIKKEKKKQLFGCMKDSVIIKGDIVSSMNIKWNAYE